jgi:hypothetical protein
LVHVELWLCEKVDVRLFVSDVVGVGVNEGETVGVQDGVREGV